MGKTALLDHLAAGGSSWHQRKTDTDRRTRSLMNQLRALHPDADVNITIVPGTAA